MTNQTQFKHKYQASMRYNWSDLDRDCNQLAGMYPHDIDGTEHVIAISGDVIPAKCIADRLELNMVQIVNVNNIPVISTPLLSGDGTMPPVPKLILVSSYIRDDILWLTRAIEICEQRGHEVHIMSLFSTGAAFKSNFFYQTFVPSGTDITFPWKI